MYYVDSDIDRSDYHKGIIQRGKDFDIMFSNNINTEMYFEAYDEDSDAEVFPSWVEDWKGFLWYCEDFLANWGYDGIADSDSDLMLIAKNGKVFFSSHYDTLADFMKAVRPFKKDHFAAAVMNLAGFEYFWVNGWSGFEKLQEKTGWFDMDVYDDWI